MAESQDYKEEMPDWTEAWSVLIRVQEDTTSTTSSKDRIGPFNPESLIKEV